MTTQEPPTISSVSNRCEGLITSQCDGYHSDTFSRLRVLPSLRCCYLFPAGWPHAIEIETEAKLALGGITSILNRHHWLRNSWEQCIYPPLWP